MKTIEQLISSEPVFLHRWTSKIDVIADFMDIYITTEEYNNPQSDYLKEKKQKLDAILPQFDNINILFASYGTDNYCGEAFVLVEKQGELYEANGSHCSCMGLEGQWQLESTNLEAIQHRLQKGTLGKDEYADNEFAIELTKFLGL